MGLFGIFKKKGSLPDNTQRHKASGQRRYDLETLTGIESIPIPQYKKLTEISSPVQNIEYILQRKASEHRKNGRMDLAIACLRKSNEIMPHSNFFYLDKDYLRLVEYLKDMGEFDEARAEEAKLRQSLPIVFDRTQMNLSILNKNLKLAKELGTDLVEMTSHNPTCGECYKYQGRVFSISGKDKRFPKLPDQVFQYGGIHEDCRHTFYPFIYGVSELSNGRKDPIAFSNRRFLDGRTAEEKAEYQKTKDDEKQYENDKNKFDLLREKLPNKAPKSFGSYRRMKSSKSKSYILLQEEALKIGIHIE